jgi:hypothetical protein
MTFAVTTSPTGPDAILAMGGSVYARRRRVIPRKVSRLHRASLP